ncbi:TadE/TadG family type IV pilus assembly protein [Thomasclavelia saccharogumia]|uniref:TadE/TadG family type IV pilus assembly protein n=1 Tax=Thomasclavelia saccharogumia TaxID=341225 RepID=UPI00047BE3DD|nr:TadE family protein [Thomasclavelia saccharogumia]
MKVVGQLKKEKGAATIVEASIVMPIVFFIVCFLFIMGYYQLEIATLQSRADRVADVASRIMVQAGYLKYGEVETNKIDFESINNFDAALIKDIFQDLDPYRYWGIGERKLDGNVSIKLENIMKKKAYFDTEASITNIEIKPKLNMLSNKVEVIVTSKVKLPGFFNFLGLPTEINKQFTSVAYVNDCSEFLRNADIVFDLGKFLAEKCKVSDNAEDVINKIIEQFSFLNFE